MKIGVFDSGLGGLAILRDILIFLPEYDYLYLGDNARVPYGGRSPECIYAFTKSAIEYLFAQDCQIVIVACNTATALALRKIQQEYLPKEYPTRRVLGVIRPAVEAVFEKGYSKVGVIGTYGTITSRSFVEEIHKLNPDIAVYQQAAPLLVPIIEEGKFEWQGLRLAIDEYIQPLLDQQIQALVLGCTHYGLISETIQQQVGNQIEVISEGVIVAQKLGNYVFRHPEHKACLSQNHSLTLCVTDWSHRYESLVDIFLGERSQKLQLVKL